MEWLNLIIWLVILIINDLYFYHRGKKRGITKDKIKLEILAKPEQIKQILKAIENNIK